MTGSGSGGNSSMIAAGGVTAGAGSTFQNQSQKATAPCRARIASRLAA